MIPKFAVYSRRLLASTAIAGLALAAPVHATPLADDTATATAADAADAGSAEADSEILVTARHREEAAQDVPVAISVLGEQSFEKTGDYTLGQIQHEVPALQVVNTNPRNSVITIRGLGANSSVAVDGLEYGVGFYIDGVYYGRPGQSQFDLVDLAQVEVLRGPQGTLFGKNTTAGAINITSKEPTFSPQLTAEGTIGNYGFKQIRVSASAPLTNKLAFRLSVADSHHDGYLTNLFDGSDAQNYDDFSIRGQLLWKPADNLKLRLIGDYSNERQHYILTLLDGTFTTFANGKAIPNNVVQRVARSGYSVPFSLPSYGAFARLGNSNSPFQANMKSYGVSGQIDYDLGKATITSISAYRWWDWVPANDVDSTPLSVTLQGRIRDYQRQFSQELRIASNGRHFIDYVAGLYYFWQTLPGYTVGETGVDNAIWSLNPATTTPAQIAAATVALTHAEANTYSVANTKSYAAYGQIDAHLTDALTLTAGLRFTHEDKNGLVDREQTPATAARLNAFATLYPSLVAAVINGNQLNNLAFKAGPTKDNALAGLATLSYKVTPDVLAYATYSRGSKSGGLNITASAPAAANPVVKPEKVDNFEIGIKSQFFNRTVTLNVDAFLTNVKDFQANISVPNGTPTPPQYISNIPKVRSKGVEADLNWSPSKWASFSGSLAYTDAKYISYANAPAAPDNPTATGLQDLSGVPLPGVSKFAYTLTADLRQPAPGGFFDAYIHADWLHRSSFNSTATNSVYGIVPGYGVLNGRIGVRSTNGRYDISLWAKNLTGKNYYVSRSGSANGLITAAIGDPRTFGATVRVKI